MRGVLRSSRELDRTRDQLGRALVALDLLALHLTVTTLQVTSSIWPDFAPRARCPGRAGCPGRTGGALRKRPAVPVSVTGVAVGALLRTVSVAEREP